MITLILGCNFASWDRELRPVYKGGTSRVLEKFCLPGKNYSINALLVDLDGEGCRQVVTSRHEWTRLISCYEIIQSREWTNSIQQVRQSKCTRHTERARVRRSGLNVTQIRLTLLTCMSEASDSGKNFSE